MNYLWFRISLCGLFLLASACDDDLDVPTTHPQVPQLPRDEINKTFIHIVSEECPPGYVHKVMKYINDLRDNHGLGSLKPNGPLTNYSLNSARFYAQNEIVGGKPYRPPNAKNPYDHTEFVFRTSKIASNLSNSYLIAQKLLATEEEVANSWLYKPNGRSSVDDYVLYGKEPVESDAEKWEYFTQMVWNATSRYGFACVTSKRTFTNNTNIGIEDNLQETTDKIVLNIVVNFDPPGNKECEYRTNVAPPVGDESYAELANAFLYNTVEPTEECKARDDFYIGMTQCPPSFVEGILGIMYKKRKNRGGDKLRINEKTLGEDSQNYVNWLVSQPHEVRGHEPNNKHGGDIVWSPDDTLGVYPSLAVSPGAFSDHLTNLESTFDTHKYFERELNITLREKYSDLTRVIWRNTGQVGLGCGLVNLPGQNRTRAIVVMNFNPPGNIVNSYADNVKGLIGSVKHEKEHPDTENSPGDLKSPILNSNGTNPEILENDEDDQDDVDDKDVDDNDVDAKDVNDKVVDLLDD